VRGFQTRSVDRAICFCMIVYGAAKEERLRSQPRPPLPLSLFLYWHSKTGLWPELDFRIDAPRTVWPSLTLSKQLGSVLKLNSLDSTRLSTAWALYPEHDELLWGQVRSGMGPDCEAAEGVMSRVALSLDKPPPTLGRIV
jgi:hypothetical protein